MKLKVPRRIRVNRIIDQPGEMLAFVREENDWSQTEAAKRMQTTLATYRSWETKKRTPGRWALEFIYTFVRLNINPKYIYHESATNSRSPAADESLEAGGIHAEGAQ